MKPKEIIVEYYVTPSGGFAARIPEFNGINAYGANNESLIEDLKDAVGLMSSYNKKNNIPGATILNDDNYMFILEPMSNAPVLHTRKSSSSRKPRTSRTSRNASLNTRAVTSYVFRGTSNLSTNRSFNAAI